jgi:hypothetical protein
VSRLPQLEAQLVDAAARRRRARAPWRGRLAVAVAAAACVAGVLVLLGRDDGARPSHLPAGVPSVPAATLALARALAAAPAPAQGVRVAHARLAALASELESRMPYPPGLRDRFDWAATPSDPSAAGAINYRAEVQRMVEYRAYCLWLRYWVSAQGDAGALRAADAVLDLVSRWPTQRGDAHAAKIAAAARAGDVGAVKWELELNCHGVG